MTPELLYQRRWERVALFVEHMTAGATLPVVMPFHEGGGILVVEDGAPGKGRAFHFFNTGLWVHVDVSEADTGAMLARRCSAFRFDAPAHETAEAVVKEISETF